MPAFNAQLRDAIDGMTRAFERYSCHDALWRPVEHQWAHLRGLLIDHQAAEVALMDRKPDALHPSDPDAKPPAREA